MAKVQPSIVVLRLFSRSTKVALCALKNSMVGCVWSEIFVLNETFLSQE
jgi:hypothetical protein